MAKIIDRITQTVYGVASQAGDAAKSIGNKVRNREGIVGKVAGTLEDAVNSTIGAGKQINDGVQKRGGYVAVAKDAKDAVVDSFKDAYHSLDQSVQDTFFTDGKFDKGKAKQVLGDTASAAAKYGKKACNKLSEMAREGKDILVEDYRRHIPTDEEISTRYAGIGMDEKGNKIYSGVLFREHYESCLTFHGQAESSIPKGVKYRKQILAEIKASASDSPAEIKEFYKDQILARNDLIPSASAKLRIIDKYFQ